MAIAPLVSSPPLAAVDGVRQVHAVLDRCEGVEGLSGHAASGLIGDVDRAVARLQALKLSLVGVVDKAHLAGDAGMTGTAAWLDSRSRTDGASAAREVKLATALEEQLPATRAALGQGQLSTEHAHVIARAAQQLPPDLDVDQKAAIEAALVARAKVVDPAVLRRTARRALEAANRSRAEVDAHEDAVLRTEEEAALAKTRLMWHDNHDGTVTGSFTVPTLAASILKKVVQQIASPRRFAQQAAKAAAASGAITAEQVAQARWDAYRNEDLDWAQKYGRALVELLEHLPTDHLTGKVNATVVVTIDHDQLKSALGAAHLDTGHDLSASQARRLACGAGLVPAVLGGQSQVLDLGRTQRFFTEAQRLALASRYHTCAADDCDRPYTWAELHHQDPWHQGGQTNLDKAVPLCGHHHRRVHDPTYHHRISTGRNGTKTVTFTRRT